VNYNPFGTENDPECRLGSQFIHPGGFLFGESNCRINTILSSCIAITLWHPERKIGGMCHFVLPEDGASVGGKRSSSFIDGRYATGAMQLFENAAAQYGTRLSEYQAKIFGGSSMMANAILDDD